MPNTKINFDNNKHLLNHNEMDKIHKEFIHIYNSLNDETNDSYKNVMIKILEHTKLHFCKEEEDMKSFNYPRKKEHIDEHNKVLSEMEFFIQRSNTKMGQMMLKSYYKEKLPDWFDLHLLSMDSDLASYLNKTSN